MITDSAEGVMWLKYQFFEKGISPHEFRKCRVKDIKEIMDIKEAIDDKAMREKTISDMRAQMRY